MGLKTLLIPFITLVLSIIAYYIGVVMDNMFLIDWAPEVGGASLVILVFFSVSKFVK